MQQTGTTPTSSPPGSTHLASWHAWRRQGAHSCTAVQLAQDPTETNNVESATIEINDVESATLGNNKAESVIIETNNVESQQP